jgi:hypothetical protein
MRRKILGLLATAALATGCHGADRGPADFNAPELGPARAALVASLDAWKAGRRESGVLIGAAPAIGIVDSLRTDRPLLGYEVVGPLLAVAKGRPFAVRLELDSPREAVDVRYVVMGRDPLWVFRHDDLDLMLHWEHKMSGEPAATTPGGP